MAYKKREKAGGMKERTRGRGKVIKTLDKTSFQSINLTLRINCGFAKEREDPARIFSCG
jgi:hypothetical protein